MSKHGDVYLADRLPDGNSATKEIKDRIQTASHMADRRGLKRVATCLALAMHLLEEEEESWKRPGA